MHFQGINKKINQLDKNLDKKELGKYLAVGLLSFFVDYTIFLAGFYILNLEIRLAGALSFSLAFMISFVLQKLWTFKSSAQKKKTFWQLTINILLVLFNLTFTTLATKHLVDLGLWPIIVRPGLFGLVMTWNFAIYKLVIFK